MKLAILLITIMYSFVSSAADNCPRMNKTIEQVSLSQLKYKDGTCAVSISPTSKFNSPYRSYSVLSDGMLMIFNSFGDGPNSSHTGARVFFFFPRQNNQITYQLNEALHEVSVQLNSQVQLNFSTLTSDLLSISGSEIKLDQKVSRNNKGGLEITKTSVLLMDMGWRLGGSPTEKMDKKSTFVDSRNKSCEILNKELFNKTSDDEFYFKMNDAQLGQFLSSRCSDLHWSL